MPQPRQHRMSRRHPASALLLLAAAGFAACTGDDDDAADTTTVAPATSEPAVEPSESAAAAAGWEQIVPGGDCQCSDGSQFSFWVREANPDKVLLFFQGGGACWSAETCARDGSDGGEEQYTPDIDPQGDSPAMRGGIFDFDDERNPFADYSVVYVPYCTGDAHLGNATTEYTPGLTIQHRGYVNGTAALDHLAATFPDATEVVVAGVSAGAAATPLYAGLVSDRLPDADITVLSDGTGASPPDKLSGALAAAWGTGNAIPDWPENAGLTAEQWTSISGMFIQSGRHDPDIVFARHDYAEDATQQLFATYTGGPAENLLSVIDGNENRIEDAGVNLYSYIAPGDDHGALQYESFYTETVNGLKLVDWVTRLIEGEPVDDVHCTQCSAG
jgi:Pectinacetylesterase